MTQLSSIKILVLGGRCVGKSAITVRFLTKRYIGEYKSNIDWLYRQMIESDDGTTNLEILDVSRCWKDENDQIDMNDQIEWAEAFVIIYSICDRHSFMRAQEFLKEVNRRRSPVYHPIILVGNKRDLEVGRQIDLKEGRTVALKFGCQFYEISAADSYVGVALVFEGLIREVRTLHSRRSHQSSNSHSHHNNTHRKLSIITVSRVFSAMFSKSHNHNNNNNNNNYNKNNNNKMRKESGVMIPITRKLIKPTISL